LYQFSTAITWAVPVDLEKLNKMWLIRFSNTFKLKDLLEIGLGFVTDVDKIGLNEAFGRRWPYLESLEERIKPTHTLIHLFHE
jgi:hypothetical protein